MNFSLHFCAELLTSEKSTTSFLSCSSVSGCPISWSSGLIPASPSLWPLFPWCNCLRVWWTCVSEADILTRQLVIKVHFFPDHLLQQHFPLMVTAASIKVINSYSTTQAQTLFLLAHFPQCWNTCVEQTHLSPLAALLLNRTTSYQKFRSRRQRKLFPPGSSWYICSK